ncbi:hypothetical protein [Plebeiibacterium sediminum]|uniref:Uncharacterized protein n=1 Tax=Plebeiibacterium sediminum TaxID=2992112 RepID=A0AAE3M9W1_9BACT|nr:hypothetical protein [Plebeiobacterium sediminum]MCW3789500.1 hypothetical protein [Plebeiobacterium sediminum]
MKQNNYPNKVRRLEFEPENTIFEFYENGALDQQITLPIGYQSITKKYFKNGIPTEAGAEYAINDIEDALMSNKSLINNDALLVTNNQKLAEALIKNGLNQEIYSRKTIEDLFNNFARIIMGSPNSMMSTEMSGEEFALILILREILHHLDFDSVKVTA